MSWDNLILVIEEANRQIRFARAIERIDPHRQAVQRNVFSRLLLSILVAWIFGSGMIIFLEGAAYLSKIGIVANACLILFPIPILYDLWKQPQLAGKNLIRLGILMTISAFIVFSSFLYLKVADLRPEFFIVCIFLIPPILVYWMAIFVSTKDIYLTSASTKYIHETEDY